MNNVLGNYSLVDHVSRASVSSCSGGTVTLDNKTLRWHLKYGGFTGPNTDAQALT